MRVTAILTPYPDGTYVAVLPALPGCVSEGVGAEAARFRQKQVKFVGVHARQHVRVPHAAEHVLHGGQRGLRHLRRGLHLGVHADRRERADDHEHEHHFEQ